MTLAAEAAALLAAMPVPAALFDLQGRLLAWSPALCELTGYTPGELADLHAGDFVGIEQVARLPAVLRTLQRRGRARVEVALTAHSGMAVPCEVRLSPFVTAEGRHVGLLAVGRDLSREQVVATALRRAERRLDEMKEVQSAFLANMSHEIRTPLTGILGFAEAIQAESEGEVAEFAALVRRSGERLMHTISALLDVAQLQAGRLDLRPAEGSARELIRRVLARFEGRAAQAGVGLQAEWEGPEEGEDALVVDPVAFERVFGHLVDNALKFTREGEVRVRAALDDESLTIVVEDTGVGIDEAFLPYLFDEFRQQSTGVARSHEGSGLGLAVTRRLVRLMGGSVAVQSTLGEGSQFALILPRRFQVVDEQDRARLDDGREAA